MSNPLSKKFGVLSLLKFTLPTTVMMVFMSLYTMVDGVFVSKLVGESALSSVNIVYPVICITFALSIMLATGGSAVIARNMGEGNKQEAKENFSLLVLVGTLLGILLALLGNLFIEPIIKGLGSTPALHDHCRDYLQPLVTSAPLAILQMLFQVFFVTAGKPKLGLYSTMAGGLANVFLDYLFMGPMAMGVQGAALGTVIGYSIPALFGLGYFTFVRRGTLSFVRPRWNRAVLAESCFNGSSEMVTNLATALTTFLFNLVMLRLLGENGVAAITIVLYSQFLLTSVYMGFSAGVAPVFSYNYGEGNSQQLQRLFKISMAFILVSSLLIFVLALTLSTHIVGIFVSPQSPVFPLAHHGFILFSVGYLFTGVNIFASSLFTAFSNGKVSAIISFLRTFVFIFLAILLLPVALGESGVWLAVPLAELLTLGVSIFFLLRLRDDYHYL